MEIVQNPHTALRATASPIKKEEISAKPTQDLIAAMKDALKKEHYGVAVAAPQVGESVRLFVVAGHVFAARKAEEYTPEAYPDRVYINPSITSRSRKVRALQEGCLSVRGKWGEVPRHERITLEYLDEAGVKQAYGASGVLAQIFQHEIDHLDGILYIDKAERVWDDKENEHAEN